MDCQMLRFVAVVRHYAQLPGLVLLSMPTIRHPCQPPAALQGTRIHPTRALRAFHRAERGATLGLRNSRAPSIVECKYRQQMPSLRPQQRHRRIRLLVEPVLKANNSKPFVFGA